MDVAATDTEMDTAEDDGRERFTTDSASSEEDRRVPTRVGRTTACDGAEDVGAKNRTAKTDDGRRPAGADATASPPPDVIMHHNNAVRRKGSRRGRRGGRSSAGVAAAAAAEAAAMVRAWRLKPLYVCSCCCCCCWWCCCGVTGLPNGSL